MVKKALLLFTGIIGIACSSNSLTAQNSSNKFGLELNAGFREYQGDMGSSLFFAKKPNYHGIGASFGYYLSPSFDFLFYGSSGDVGYYTTLPNVPPPTKFAGFRARIVDVSAGFRYKLANGYLLPEDAFFAPYFFAGWGGLYIHSRIENVPENYTGSAGNLNGGAGIQLNFGPTFAVRFQSALNYTFNDIWDGDPYAYLTHKRQKNNDVFAYQSIGLVYNFGGGNGPTTKPLKDSDGDGVPDKYDLCKKTPMGHIVDSVGCSLDTDKDGIFDHEDSCVRMPGTIEFFGCPDTDGDGIPDNKDRCPNDSGSVQFNGCPDTDGDGIPDVDDQCPDKAGLKQFNGCPDTDGDGVEDRKDKCPTIPGPVAGEGCPDTDGDGVYDHKDKCPDKPGTIANKGCPEIKKEVMQKIALAAKGINFETGKATITKASYANLDKLVEILKQYPEATAVIEGHTDNQGNAELNRKLSQERADAVKAYLVSKGIDASRLTAIGYGPDKPVDTNDTAAGRAKNRRVDFRLEY